MSGSSTPLVSGTTANPMQDFLDMLSKAKIKNDDDYKSIKIPQFSDGSDWDAVVFELEINLEQYWKHQNDLDIVDYLNGIQQHCDQKFIDKADKLIYHAIVTAAKRDSFARNQIMASRHADAVPRVERNQGFKLFCLFQDIFTNKSKSKANLPNALLTFNQMKMSAKESAKDYISRVDLAVSDLALLNEKVSVNSWLFILSNSWKKDLTPSQRSKTKYCKRKRSIQLANLTAKNLRMNLRILKLLMLFSTGLVITVGRKVIRKQNATSSRRNKK
jgi:hypothetical protein